MLTEQTGIERVQKLYLQMLFRCNFNCAHCFQGEKLQRNDRLSIVEVESVISLFSRGYGLKSVTLLGGEPFIHPDLVRALQFCKAHGLETVICTNGYRIRKVLGQAAPFLDHLRVSIDGNRETHDAIRRSGSFDAALETLQETQKLGVVASVTMTVMQQNVGQLYELAQSVAPLGVHLIKLHQLRLVGNAENRPELLCEESALEVLNAQVSRVRAELGFSIMLDDDLDAGRTIIPDDVAAETFELERIEVQPDGAMYISCKAVGSDSNAFWFEKTTGQIAYRPTQTDELAVCAPQVRYARLEGKDRHASIPNRRPRCAH